MGDAASRGRDAGRRRRERHQHGVFGARRRPLAGGTLRLVLAQPLRVESGRLELSLPAGRTPQGAVVRERVAVDLEPSGRQIDAGMDWTSAVAPGAVLRIGARLIREPGHVAARNPEAIAFAGLRIRM